MFNRKINFLFVLLLFILFIPCSVFANTGIDSESNDSTEVIDSIKDIIGQNLSIDLVESQSYDYDEFDNSILNTTVVNETELLLDENDIDYDLLGYSFSADFVNYNSFDYSGTVSIFQDGLFVDSVNTSITFSNTDSHTEDEQNYVNDFLNNNDFNFDSDIYLENYESDSDYVLENVSLLASSYGITCKSMVPPYITLDRDFPFICFYNDKFYGTLVANVNRNIIVAVPFIESDRDNALVYTLDKVKNFFINYYENKGIFNYITNSSSLHFDEGRIITNTGVVLGNFVLEYNGSIPPTNYNNTNDNVVNNVGYTSGYSYNYGKTYRNVSVIDYDSDEDVVEIINISTEKKNVLSKKKTKKVNKTKKTTQKKQTSKKKNKPIKINWNDILKTSFIFIAGMWFGGIIVFLIRRRKKKRKRIIPY